MLIVALLLAVIGQVLWGIHEKLSQDSGKEKTNFNRIISILSIVLSGFGYVVLSLWVGHFSKVAAGIMLISILVFLVSMIFMVIHRLPEESEEHDLEHGRTDAVLETGAKTQKKTNTIKTVGYAGLALYALTLFFMIGTKRTYFPAWACVFNTLVIMIPFSFIKLPVKRKGTIAGTTAGTIMFFGLFVLTLADPILRENAYLNGEMRNRMEMTAPIARWSESDRHGNIANAGWILCYSGDVYHYDEDDVKETYKQGALDSTRYLIEHTKPSRHISIRTVDQICDLLDRLEVDDSGKEKNGVTIGAPVAAQTIALYKENKLCLVSICRTNMNLPEVEPAMEAIGLLSKEFTIYEYERLK